MIPDEVLSTVAVPALFYPPRNRIREKLVDYDMGGVAIQDPSEGLQVKVWRCRFIDGDFVLDADDVAETVVYTPDVAAVEIGFTFDQNMQPFLTWIDEEDDSFFRWYDTTIADFVVTQLDGGTITPRCALDDKRNASGVLAGLSDVILTYLRDDTLYFRAQRDRYDTEYELATGYEQWRLGQFGIARNLRMQWHLIPPS